VKILKDTYPYFFYFLIPYIFNIFYNTFYLLNKISIIFNNKTKKIKIKLSKFLIYLFSFYFYSNKLFTNFNK
jgi:hypothetical protein